MHYEFSCSESLMVFKFIFRNIKIHTTHIAIIITTTTTTLLIFVVVLRLTLNAKKC